MNCQNCDSITRVVDTGEIFTGSFVLRECVKCFLQYSFYKNRLDGIGINLNGIFYTWSLNSGWLSIQGIPKVKLNQIDDNYAKYFFKYIDNLMFE